MSSFEDRCLGINTDIGQARGVAVNNVAGGNWYPAAGGLRQDIMILECYFYANNATPSWPLVPKIYAILNQFNGIIHTLSLRGNQLEFRITGNNGGATSAAISGGVSNTQRWYHTVVAPSAINGVFNFYWAETGRNRDGTLFGAFPDFPSGYNVVQSAIAGSTMLIGTRLQSFNPVRIGLMRYHNQGGGGTNSDLNGGVSEFRIWRDNSSISNATDREAVINSAKGRFIDGTEYPFLEHCFRLNEQASTASDFVDVGVAGAQFSEFATGTDYFDSHPFVDEAPSQVIDLTQAPFLDSGVNESTAQTAEFTQLVTEEIEMGVAPTIQVADFTQTAVPVRIHVVPSSQQVDFTQIVVNGLHKTETLTIQTADFTQTVTTLRILLGAFGGQTLDLTQAVTDILLRSETVPNQTVDLTDSVTVLVERNIAQQVQTIALTQAVVDSFSMGESRSQTVDFTQVVAAPVQKDRSEAQTVDLTQSVSAPVTRFQTLAGQIVDLTQSVSVSTDGNEEPTHNVRVTQLVGLSVTRNLAVVQTVDFTDLGSPLNFSISHTVEFQQGLTLLEILAQTLDLTQNVSVSLQPSGLNPSATIDLTQAVTVVKVYNPAVTQVVDLSQTTVNTGNIDVSVASTVNFTDTMGEGTLTENVSQSVGFGQSVGASKDLETLQAAITEDYLAYSADAAESIFYRQETQVSRTSTGQRVVEGPITTVDMPYATRRMASEQEINTFNGKVRVGDVRWELPKDLMNGVVPEEGDTITSKDLNGNDEVWNVVAVDVATIKTRFRVFGRKIR